MFANDDYILEVLLNGNWITPDSAEEARLACLDDGISPLDWLIANERISKIDVLGAMANDAGLPFQETIDQIEFSAIESIPRDVATRYGIIPLHAEETLLRIGISNPYDFETIDNLRTRFKREIEAVVVPPETIEEAISRFYPDSDPAANANIQAISLEGGGEGEGDAPIIKLVHSIITEAYRLKASDIHIEPMERRLRLRYRIDGVLQVMPDPPKKLQSAVISRLKIMSKMSIAEKRLPQDGRIQLQIGERTSIDLRVSTVPTNHGEGVVMRILDKSSLMLGLPELGFLTDDQAVMERILGLSDGIFLVTGPTGSGKTTTLYACLNTINKPDRKIITVEDPVEYQLPGINQVPVNDEVGMTFAAALRAMLRQAPNIIMLGEIRDAETANIAINASLTGHLVFSTLHTNDAPSAVTRLADIGVKPFLVASSIRAIMAQRLVRKNCANCAESYEPTESELQALNLKESQLSEAQFKKGKGCAKCRGTGFKGRIGIFEIFIVDDEIRNMINEKKPTSALRQRARDIGMRTLREDGIRKVLAGMTTPDEVISSTMKDKD